MLVYTQALTTERERSKFEQIYIKYRRLMFQVAHRLLDNEYDAEDAVHQAFVSIAENMKKISQVDCPKTRSFCVIVVERKALNIIRQRRRIADSYDVELAGVAVPMAEGTDLAMALSRLPASHRQALLLRYHMGYTTREVADIMEQSLSNTQKLLWRAKQKLQELLEGDDESYE